MFGVCAHVWQLRPPLILDGTSTLLGIYLPLLGVMLALFHGQGTGPARNEEAPKTMLAFTRYVVLAWMAAPPILIVSVHSTDVALAIIKGAQAIVGSVATGSVALLFARTGPDVTRD